MSTPLSKRLADKSISAAVAAIEIYNKPDFHYREEAFSLLMTNAWELLCKAKWLSDHGDDIACLYDYRKDASGNSVAKTNRCGNPITLGLSYLSAKLGEDSASGLEPASQANIVALIEIRDNAAHFVNKDLAFGRRVLEVGTASLQNYLHLITEWFGVDLSKYNFFLMPISFYHGFETVTSSSVSPYPEQMQRLLDLLDRLEQEAEPDEKSASNQHVSLRLETRLIRSKDNESSMAFRWTDDPNAPAVRISEADVLKTFPLTYRDLCSQLRRRYDNFVENNTFHKIRRALEQESKLSIVRLLNPGSPTTARQRFYSPNIISRFDAHYKRRRKDSSPKSSGNANDG